MNERIKTCLVKCGMPNEDLVEIFSDTNKSFYMVQFAKLVIQECANLIKSKAGQIDNMASNNVFRSNIMQEDAKIILAHFGVKE